MPAEASPAQRKEKINKTGLPNQSKSGIESLSSSPLVGNRSEPAPMAALQSLTNDREQVKQLSAMNETANRTGLPDGLKSGIENLSGYSMDDVKVHYNSDQPAQLQAHAYAQGTDIHLASGQEKHLPHEAWHVVQQKQGRVAATLQMQGGIQVNDNAGLEREADMMGSRALTAGTRRGTARALATVRPAMKVLQGVWAYVNDTTSKRLRMQSHSDGTYTYHGRRFDLLSAGPPLIVREIPAHEDGRSGETPARTRDQRGDASGEDNERPTRRLRVESVDGSVPGTGSGVIDALSTPTFTDEEMRRIGAAETYRVGPRGRIRPLYGDSTSDDFYGRACWNWALSGASGDAINPGPMFDMLSDESHNADGGLYADTFNDAWERFVPRPVEGTTEEQQRAAGVQQAAYERYAEDIRALWERRRARSNVRRRSRNDDSIERITNDAVRLSMQMNGLEPADENELTRFSIAMARHPHRGVNWSHWGLEVDGHSFETIPGSGLWHQREGFRYWATQDHSIEDSQVTRVPLRHLAPGHLVGVRGLLNIMGAGSQTSSTSLRRTRSSRRSGSNRRGGQVAIMGAGSQTSLTSLPATLSSRRSDSNRRGGQVAMQIVAPGNNLDAGGMLLHYFGILAAVNAQGTYSEEFHWVRNNPPAAQLLLQQGGMSAVAALAFLQQFAVAVNHAAQQNVPYVAPETQEQIFNTLGNQEQLFAIVRYLRQQAGQQAQRGQSADTAMSEEHL